MHSKSLAIQTDYIFGRFFGEVFDRGSYMGVKTPSSPNYFWGNYLVMPAPPAPGALNEWIALYNSEFDYKKQGFITFAVDAADGAIGAAHEFHDFGFSCETSKVRIGEDRSF